MLLFSYVPINSPSSLSVYKNMPRDGNTHTYTHTHSCFYLKKFALEQSLHDINCIILFNHLLLGLCIPELCVGLTLLFVICVWKHPGNAFFFFSCFLFPNA